MSLKVYVIAMMIVVFMAICSMPSIGQAGENEQLRVYYSQYILKCISKNQSKADLQNSKSSNLQSYAALCKQRVVFLTHNQNMLVDEMIKQKIGKKPYKIEHYLNSKFHETYR